MTDFSSIERPEISGTTSMYLKLNTEAQFPSSWHVLPQTETRRIKCDLPDDSTFPRLHDVHISSSCQQTVSQMNPLLTFSQRESTPSHIITRNNENQMDEQLLKANSRSRITLDEKNEKQQVTDSEIIVAANTVSSQLLDDNFSRALADTRSQHCHVENCENSSNRTNDQRKSTETFESSLPNRHQNVSTEEMFQAACPSAQSSYHEEPIEHTMCPSGFHISNLDIIHNSKIANTGNTNDETVSYTEISNDNPSKHNTDCPNESRGNLSQYTCCQSELNLGSSYLLPSIPNTAEEHVSLEISSETQRAMESSNSTPPSAEKFDFDCQKQNALLLSPSQHSPNTKSAMNNPIITSDWTQHGQLTDNYKQSNQTEEHKTSCSLKENINDQAFLEYTAANSTIMQSPITFTDDHMDHSMASSDGQSSVDESDEGMSLANFEHYTNSMQPNHAGVFFCHLCDFAGSCRQEFQDHLRSHYDYKCLKCDYTSRTEGRLKRHLKDFHSDVPPENFSGKTIRSVRPKLQRCKQCDFVTDTKDEFWRHLRLHIKEDKRLECHLCCFITEYKHHLEYHMRNHMGSKPYKCPKCNYECVNKSMLNSHMKSHSNVYPYRCANCHYATKYCHSLKLHLTKHEHKPAVVLNADGSLPPYDNTVELMNVRRGPNIRHSNSKINYRYRNSSGSTKNKVKESSSFRSVSENNPVVDTTMKFSPTKEISPDKRFPDQGVENINLVITSMPVNCTSSFNVNQPVPVFQTLATTGSNNIPFPNPSFTSPPLFPTYAVPGDVSTSFMEPLASAVPQTISLSSSLNILSSSGNLITDCISNTSNTASHGTAGQSISVNPDPVLNYSVSAYSSMVAFMAAMQCGDFNRARLISSASKSLSDLPDLNFIPPNSVSSSDITKSFSNEFNLSMSSTPLASSNCKGYAKLNEFHSNSTQLSGNDFPKFSNSLNDQRNSLVFASSSTSPTGITTPNKSRIPIEKESMKKESLEIGETSRISCSNSDKIKGVQLNKHIRNDFESALDLSSASRNKKNIGCDKFHMPSEFHFIVNTAESNEQILQGNRHGLINSYRLHSEFPNSKSSAVSLSISSTDTFLNNNNNNSNNNNNNNNSQDFTYECRFCEIRFRQRTLYDIHMGFHSHSDPYLCNRCGHQSSDSVEFFTHLGEEAHYS
ncbi:unnamed protein product [Heterobilharzia americana]|nr:unnamed protein product [Heterobilharzia americana]